MPVVRRRLWQIHLSTAVVVVLVSGTLLGINMRPPRVISAEGKVNKYGGLWIAVEYQVDGWPFATQGVTTLYTSYTESANIRKYAEARIGNEVPIPFNFKNFAAAIAIVLAVAVMSEFILRRRESRFH